MDKTDPLFSGLLKDQNGRISLFLGAGTNGDIVLATVGSTDRRVRKEDCWCACDIAYTAKMPHSRACPPLPGTS